MKTVVVLGSTGSIGRSTLDVIRGLGPEYRVWGLTAKTNLKLLADQAHAFQPRRLAIPDSEGGKQILERLNGLKIDLLYGEEALVNLAQDPQADIVVNALVGGIGLKATLAALKAGKFVALANKESIVMAGRLVREIAGLHGATLIPVDSEHSAVHQCLKGEDSNRVAKLILTASGGPFLRRDVESFKFIRPEEALKHPNWNMGPKITIDSATLMNKGLEVIEAHYLFDLPPEKIEVVIHPQSVVHSLVEFVDGSIKAQMSLPDMRLPIQYALTYPDRLPYRSVTTELSKIGALEFESPDLERFPCLGLAYQALKMGEGFPAVLSAANEVAVQAFLGQRLAFDQIPAVILEVLKAFSPPPQLTLEAILEADRWARNRCSSLLND